MSGSLWTLNARFNKSEKINRYATIATLSTLCLRLPQYNTTTNTSI